VAIDGWTLGLQAINVIVLIWILSRFLFRPVADIIKARQAAAQKLLDEAAHARADAEDARAAAQAEKQRQTEARDARVREAQAEAESTARAALETARAEAAALVQDARADSERLRSSERLERERQAAGLAVDIAAKLLERLPPGLLIESFAAGLAQELRALPESARREIGAGARLLVSHPLRDVERARVTAAVEGALGRPVELTFAVDPGLIAGLEIETPHAKVDNNFREDLRRIREEFAREPG
jgi:F-type H+-transporting ATPase subunit b